MGDLLDILFPAKCPLCGGMLCRGESGICGCCRPCLPEVTEPCCKHCGKPVSSLEQEYCADCRDRPNSVLEMGTALWVYTDDIKKAMADFKYRGCRIDGESYGTEFVAGKGEILRQWDPSCIVPVPLYWRKRWFRGFNQAACLAESIGRKLGIPVLPDALIRTRSTRPQKGLDPAQRRDNLKGAFTVDPRWRKKIAHCQCVLIVDDIYTTGATLEACGAALRDTGVEKIYFACLCIGGAS